MKKIIITFILLAKTFAAYCDVIFYPAYRYNHHDPWCYSTEFIYSFEKAKGANGSNVFWFGAGCVGSLKSISRYSYGAEIALEKRLYFQENYYKHFFLSAYIGSAYMTDFNYISNFGVIPGIKFNYKAVLSKKLLLEPYISLSYPFTHDFKGSTGIKPISVVTFGARLGLFKIKNSN